MQVIGYARVSTEDQAREGVSVSAQEAKSEAYATVKDWTLREIVRDEGVSAKSLKRPGLERLLALVDAGEVEAVIVHKLDRLTRSVVDLDRLMKLFERQDVALASLQEALDATTATGRLMVNPLASVSQWEREVIGERTRLAMQHLKAQGQGDCRPVFDDPAPLTWMPAERAAGRSYDAIAAALNVAGTPTTRGGRWQGDMVRRILLRSMPRRERRVASWLIRSCSARNRSPNGCKLAAGR